MFHKEKIMPDRIDIILIHPPYHRRWGSGSIFPIGLGYLASAAESHGFRVSIIDCSQIFASLHPIKLKQLSIWLTEKLKATNPKLAIGIGPCTTSTVRGINAIAHTCKHVLPNIPIIYGGPLASIPGLSQLFFEQFGAAAVVPGDGDQVICDILSALSEKRDLSYIDGVTTQDRVAPDNIVKNLDTLLFPTRKWKSEGFDYRLSVRRDLFDGKFATMITSRGCPHRCKFCVSAILRNGQYTKRSVNNVLDEIELLRFSHGVDTIVFYDDNFFVSPESLVEDTSEFVQGIAKLRNQLTWQIEIRPDVLVAFDKSLAASLYSAGCRQINIGIEKADSAKADLIGKNTDTDQIKHVIEEIHLGAPALRLTSTFILGGPYEDHDSVMKTIELANELDLLFAHFYPLELYPGTDMYNMYFPNQSPIDWYQRIIADDLPWGELLYESPQFTRKEILSLVSEAYISFYRRDQWQATARHFLGMNYSIVANAVEKWCYDRFALKTGIE